MAEALKHCIYRVAAKNDNGTVGARISAWGITAVAGAGLKGDFDCGVCKLLTADDIGPVACQQPQHDEKSCPDIAYLRDPKTA